MPKVDKLPVYIVVESVERVEFERLVNEMLEKGYKCLGAHAVFYDTQAHKEVLQMSMLIHDRSFPVVEHM